MHSKVTSISLVIISILFSGCLTGPSEPSYYYTLHSSGAARPVEMENVSAIERALFVSDASIAEGYERRQLVERIEKTRIRYLSNHLWASDPARAVANIIAQRLDELSLFSSVRRQNRSPSPRYILETSIQQMEIQLSQEPANGFIQMELRLLDRNTQATILQQSFEQNIPLDNKNRETDFTFGVQNFLVQSCDAFFSEVVTILHEKS